MAVVIHCECGGKFKVKPEHVGKRFQCPACGKVTVAQPPGVTSLPNDTGKAAAPLSKSQSVAATPLTPSTPKREATLEGHGMTMPVARRRVGLPAEVPAAVDPAVSSVNPGGRPRVYGRSPKAGDRSRGIASRAATGDDSKAPIWIWIMVGVGGLVPVVLTVVILYGSGGKDRTEMSTPGAIERPIEIGASAQNRSNGQPISSPTISTTPAPAKSAQTTPAEPAIAGPKASENPPRDEGAKTQTPDSKSQHAPAAETTAPATSLEAPKTLPHTPEDDERRFQRAGAAIAADPDLGGKEPVEGLLTLLRMKNAGLVLVEPGSTHEVPVKLSVAELHRRFGTPEKQERVKVMSLSMGSGPFGSVPSSKDDWFNGHRYGPVTALEQDGQIMKVAMMPPPGVFLADVWKCLRQRPPVQLDLPPSDPQRGIWSDKEWHIRALSIRQSSSLDVDGKTRTFKNEKQGILVELEVTALTFGDYEAPGATIQHRTIGPSDIRIVLPSEAAKECNLIQIRAMGGGWGDLHGKAFALYPHSPRTTLRAVSIRDTPAPTLSGATVELFRSKTAVVPPP